MSDSLDFVRERAGALVTASGTRMSAAVGLNSSDAFASSSSRRTTRQLLQPVFQTRRRLGGVSLGRVLTNRRGVAHRESHTRAPARPLRPMLRYEARSGTKLRLNGS